MNSDLQRRRRGRAGAFLLRVLVLLAALTVLFLPSCSSRLGRTSSDPSSIDTYRAAMDLSADGQLVTTETLDVLTGPDRHGIFRIFDTAPRSGKGPEHPVDEVSVTRDGVSEPATFVTSAQGTTTLRIGDPNVILDEGLHRYTITSRTTRVLEPTKDGTVQWWWNVVGSGWQMTMQKVNVEVRLPAEPAKVECVQGEDTPCDATVAGRTLTLSTGPLATYTPVTLRVTFPKGALPVPPGGVPGPDLDLPLALLAALLAAAAVAWVWRATREREPGFPVLFEPPEGVSPAVGVMVLDEAEAPEALQATLFHLAESGYLQIVNNGTDWTVACVRTPDLTQLHPAEVEVLSKCGLTEAGAQFQIGRTSASGAIVNNAKRALHKAVRTDTAQYLTRSGAGTWARLLGWGGCVFTLVLAGTYHVGGGGDRNVPLTVLGAVLGIGLIGVALDPRSRTVHTEAGRELWSRVGGFARFLSTESSEARFDAAAHQDWFARYLPWAVALGVSKEWAKRYEAQGVDPTTAPTPWLFVPPGTPTWGSTSMSDAFTNAIGSASAAYAASQVSSGGGGFGGGGFSGGSGGGGGGGGSW